MSETNRRCDHLRKFLAEWTERNERGRIGARLMHTAYVEWCRRNLVVNRRYGQGAIQIELARMGFQVIRLSNGRAAYVNVRLTEAGRRATDGVSRVYLDEFRYLPIGKAMDLNEEEER